MEDIGLTLGNHITVGKEISEIITLEDNFTTLVKVWLVNSLLLLNMSLCYLKQFMIGVKLHRLF